MRILVSLCGLASITNIIKATSLQLMTMRSIRCWVPARWMRSFLSCDYIFPRSYIYIQTNEVLYQNKMCVSNGIWCCQCKVCGSASSNVRSIEMIPSEIRGNLYHLTRRGRETTHDSYHGLHLHNSDSLPTVDSGKAGESVELPCRDNLRIV